MLQKLQLVMEKVSIIKDMQVITIIIILEQQVELLQQ